MKTFFRFLFGKGVSQYKLGDTIQFKGSYHASVGLDYYLEYDKSAFSITETSNYENPSRSHMPGGDRKEVTYTLSCLKTGNFQIKEIESFRGNENVIAEHLIHVRDSK